MGFWCVGTAILLPRPTQACRQAIGRRRIIVYWKPVAFKGFLAYFPISLEYSLYILNWWHLCERSLIIKEALWLTSIEYWRTQEEAPWLFRCASFSTLKEKIFQYPLLWVWLQRLKWEEQFHLHIRSPLVGQVCFKYYVFKSCSSSFSRLIVFCLQVTAVLYFEITTGRYFMWLAGRCSVWGGTLVGHISIALWSGMHQPQNQNKLRCDSLPAQPCSLFLHGPHWQQSSGDRLRVFLRVVLLREVLSFWTCFQYLKKKTKKNLSFYLNKVNTPV